MEIIVIDDGVNEDCFRIGTLKHNIEVLETLEIAQRTGYDSTKESHGSICAGIIKQYAPSCEIGSIKVMDPDLYNGTSRQLSVALEWCIKANIKLINMSLGTIDFRDFEEIRVLIARLLRNKCIIIAACHNGNSYSIPACLSGVISVASDCSHNNSRYRVNPYYLEQADVYALSQHLMHGHNKQVLLEKEANSYAAPMITGMVYQLLQQSLFKKPCIVKMKLWNTKENFKFMENIEIDESVKIAGNRIEESGKYGGFGYSIRPDFIDSAIVLNYSNHTADENFFFRVLKWYEKPDLSSLKLDDASFYLVILLGDGELHNSTWNEEINHFVLEYTENINGILYGGVMPVEFKRICEEKIYCLIWDEDAYKRLLQQLKAERESPVNIVSSSSAYRNESSDECNIPVIHINGTEKNAMLAASLLEKEFYNDDYYVIKASGIKGSYLYGIEYIPYTITAQYIFNYWEDRYKNNAILFVDTAPGIKEMDMQITIWEDSNIMEFSKDRINISTSFLSTKIKEIYQYIKKCF